MKITLDREADALYVYLKDGEVARSVASGKNVVIDEDANGEIIGVEILNLSKNLGESGTAGISLEITEAALKR